MSFDVKAVFPLMGKPDLPIKCVKPVFLKVGEFSPTFALINFSVYTFPGGKAEKLVGGEN